MESPFTLFKKKSLFHEGKKVTKFKPDEDTKEKHNCDHKHDKEHYHHSGEDTESIVDMFGIPFEKFNSAKVRAKMINSRGFLTDVTLVLTNRELYIYNDIQVNPKHQRLIVLGPDIGIVVNCVHSRRIDGLKTYPIRIETGIYTDMYNPQGLLDLYFEASDTQSKWSKILTAATGC